MWTSIKRMIYLVRINKKAFLAFLSAFEFYSSDSALHLQSRLKHQKPGAGRDDSLRQPLHWFLKRSLAHSVHTELIFFSLQNSESSGNAVLKVGLFWSALMVLFVLL